MQVRCRLEFRYPSRGDAEVVARSLKVDDAPFVRTTVEGAVLVAESEADSPMSLLHTLEDYLACLAVAESVLRG